MFFIPGFIAGYIAKEMCTNKKVRVEKQTKNYFMCKITHQNVFNELFPKLPNDSASRVQPLWEFCEKNGTIRIEIKPLKFYDKLTFENLVSWNGLDLSVFQEFGECYIYIEINNIIMVYRPGSVIDDTDFFERETELSKKYNGIICAVFDNEYRTKHFKKFLYNTLPLTPEIINDFKKIKSVKIVTTESKYFLTPNEIV